MAIVAALGYRFGAEPFLEGLRRTDATALAVALAITAGTTWCCALRWSLLADRLEVGLPVAAAYRACYRAQLLNVTLPGGVVGDAHRAIRHARDSGEWGRALRSVVWDRGTGQAAQVALAAGAVLLLPTAVRTPVLGLLVGALVLVVVAGFAVPRQVVRTFGAETRRVLGAGAWQTVLLLSVVAAGGHLLVFVVAARTAGVTAPMHELVPLGLLVLLGSAVPLGVAGWGPREGVAAWAFAAAGLGGATGLSVAVVYGVMSMVATLPGVLTLGIGPRRGAGPGPRVAAPLDRAGARHG